jgi:hypothetical protein
MTHDHRCPSLRYVVLGGRVCVCYTIAEVRREMLAKCIEAVESLGHVTDCMWSHDEGAPCPHEDSVAALRALEEKS